MTLKAFPIFCIPILVIALLLPITAEIGGYHKSKDTDVAICIMWCKMAQEIDKVKYPGHRVIGWYNELLHDFDIISRGYELTPEQKKNAKWILDNLDIRHMISSPNMGEFYITQGDKWKERYDLMRKVLLGQ